MSNRRTPGESGAASYGGADNVTASHRTADHGVRMAGEIDGTGSRGPIRSLLAGMIRLYQRYLSPLTPPSCRFTPTCSEYTRQAILKHGPLKGVWLGARRLSKCHPWHPGGHDPVP